MKYAGMEHWGAITFGPIYLETYPNSSVSSKIDCYHVIVHEISHMWFGNLVALDWWGELWLKEGFARFSENKCLKHIRPELQTDRGYFISMTSKMFDTDMSPSVSSVRVEFNPNNTDSIFGSEVYNKGGSIVRMIENFVGDNTFRQVLIEYLNMYMYKNVDEGMFLDVLEKYAGVGMKEMVKTWTGQRGFPLVTVEKVDESNYILKQEAFAGKPRSIWSIPVVYLTDDMNIHSTIMSTETLQVKLENPSLWIKLNHMALGYYYVKYDRELLRSILRRVHDFSTQDRTGLLHNYIKLAQRQIVTWEEVGEIIYENGPDTNYPYVKLVTSLFGDSVYSHRMSPVLNYLFYPLWERYQLALHDPADGYLVDVLVMAYKLLVPVNRNKEIANCICRAGREEDLSSELLELHMISRVIIEDVEELKNNLDTSSYILFYSKNVELVKSVIATHRDKNAFIRSIVLIINVKKYCFHLLFALFDQLKNDSLKIIGAILSMTVDSIRLSNDAEYSSLLRSIEELEGINNGNIERLTETLQELKKRMRKQKKSDYKTSDELSNHLSNILLIRNFTSLVFTSIFEVSHKDQPKGFGSSIFNWS